MIDKLDLAKYLQLLRYLIVGGLNTLISLAVYYLALHSLGLPYYVASAMAVIAGILVGFKAHGTLVFNNKGNFFKYVMVWVSIYIGNIVLIALVRDYTGDYWAPILLLPFTTLLAYILLKKVVYKP